MRLAVHIRLCCITIGLKMLYHLIANLFIILIIVFIIDFTEHRIRIGIQIAFVDFLLDVRVVKVTTSGIQFHLTRGALFFWL